MKIKKKYITLGLLLILLNIGILFSLMHLDVSKLGFMSIIIQHDNASDITEEEGKPDEIIEITKSKSLKEQELLYTQLIERIGPVDAQYALYRSGLPFDGQTHLLNHTVGDWLFETFSDEGIVYCKDYFLSSCYHGFLIRFIGEKGIENLDSVMEQCNKASATTAVQCAHGIGHGLLANYGYTNLPEALQACDRVSLISSDFPLYHCHDGVFMENAWAVHEDGRPSPDRWIDPDDPVFPCNDPRIGEQYRKACWSNQPHVMLKDFFKGNIQRVSAECLKITNEEYQTTCFDAIARQIQPLTRNSVDETFRLCGQLPDRWNDECVRSVVRAYFSIGDRNIPFEICSRVSLPSKNACYVVLASSIKAYTAVQTYQRQELCRRIPIPSVLEYCLSS